MSFSSANPSHLFIDLATFSEPEGFLYGGPEAITWFVAAVQKANWFSYLPITLRHNGVVDFGPKNVSASVNRSGDYVLNIWFRAQIPQIEMQDPLLGVGQGAILTDARIRWTRNLMHNLFEKVNISFNELVVQEFDNYWMDFNFVFRVPSSKRVIYANMIGTVSDMVDDVAPNVALGTGGYFSVVFPFWFGEDSGIALPVAALPFNDIKVNYTLRRWEELVVIFPGTTAAGAGGGADTAATLSIVKQFDLTTVPALIDPSTNAHYAVVHNDERVKMGDAPRDILIHQVQSTQVAPFKDVTTRSTFDLRLSHSIVLFCFAAQNVSIQSFTNGANGAEWSNYTTEPAYLGLDPIAFTTLVYENTVRLAQGSDYYSFIYPFLFSDAGPTEPEHTGMHMWSYSLRPWDPLKPAGSTNHSKLANVSISHDMSPAALASVATPPTGTGAFALLGGNSTIEWPVAKVLANMVQVYRHVFLARNWNIVRCANGSTQEVRNRQLPPQEDKQCYCLVIFSF